MPGKRRKIGVTFQDLENLSKLLEAQPKSIAEAASLLSVQRAYLYRLIERINKIIGDPPPEWRQRKGLILPVEVRRLVRAYRLFHDSQEDLVRFPRVSAGSCASLLLSDYLAKILPKAGRLMVVRSRETAEALRAEMIDVALGHETFLGGFAGDLESRRLLRWSSVVARPRSPQGRRWIRLAWEPRSIGAALNASDGEQQFGSEAGQTIFHATSFAHAIELVKLGFVEKVVLPDIYLSELDRRDLIVDRPARAHEDHLVALFRAYDEIRLDWLLDLEIWKSVGVRPLDLRAQESRTA